MSATKPSMFREPKTPWIGPNRATFPWMPSTLIGTSSRMPATTSRASETPRSTRMTSPNARTIWIVSRISAM
ncbi:hypothetical protein QFZ26_002984 [Agromyces ramosus]|uniref:Uncharacterized protein n=1 Tax=Agromyces ramosus TaxID=33879 RepID=A0ABU0RBI2_9MICO|nr:hypothetical protein [Agromyces ramosus]